MAGTFNQKKYVTTIRQNFPGRVGGPRRRGRVSHNKFHKVDRIFQGWASGKIHNQSRHKLVTQDCISFCHRGWSHKIWEVCKSYCGLSRELLVYSEHFLAGKTWLIQSMFPTVPLNMTEPLWEPHYLESWPLTGWQSLSCIVRGPAWQRCLTHTQSSVSHWPHRQGFLRRVSLFVIVGVFISWILFFSSSLYIHTKGIYYHSYCICTVSTFLL